jgi:hypothetical protein
MYLSSPWKVDSIDKFRDLMESEIYHRINCPFIDTILNQINLHTVAAIPNWRQ